MTRDANDKYLRKSLIHKSNRPLDQQLSVWRESPADIVVLLVLANEAVGISGDWSALRLVNAYGLDERLLKYCALGSSNRFSTYTVMKSSETSATHTA